MLMTKKLTVHFNSKISITQNNAAMKIGTDSILLELGQKHLIIKMDWI